MRTNRDFYQAIAFLLEEKKENTAPTLEEYLGNLRRGIGKFSDRPAISLEQFFGLLRDAFGANVIESSAANVETESDKGCAALKELLDGQIRDLVAMAENGQLEDEQKYFGIDGPSGDRWYNFDPCTYVECDVAGSLGGWEEGDNTGRSYVPGEVAMYEDGVLKSCDQREVDDPIVEIPKVTWEMFSDFVWCGQDYE